MFEPQIQIYPVSEMGEVATHIVQELEGLLAEKPAYPTGGIPILPIMPAGQLLDAQIKYVTFNGGSGIRVLTPFAQASGPIDNEDLDFVFQGLTDDDGYYISAFLPVGASFLPDHVDDPGAVPAVDGVLYPEFDSADFDAEYLRYWRAILNKLNTTSPEEFQPSLSALDSLIESLQVEVASAAEPTALAPCVNGLPTRLRVNGFAYVNPDPPLPNNVRREAGKDNPLIGEIQPGAAIKVLEGPICVDGWVWWKVRTLQDGLTGLTAEGDRQNYCLIPCASRSECGGL